MVRTFEILRQPYGMDVARMTMDSFINEVATPVQAGDPIIFTWGTATNRHTFYGYVFIVRPYVDNLIRKVEIVATSVPTPMSVGKKTRTFRRMSVSNVVQEIADYHLLNAEVAAFTGVNDYHQKDQNDWTFLLDLASQTKSVLLSVDATLVFMPLKDYLAQSRRVHLHASTARQLMNRDANLLSFGSDDSLWQPIEIISDSSEVPEYLVSLLTEQLPSSAYGALLNPGDIRPLDTFRVLTDQDPMSWTVTKVVYSWTEEMYVPRLEFGGDGVLYESTPGDSYDISAALFRGRTKNSPVPVLTGFVPVIEDVSRVWWRAPVVVPPTVQEDAWLSV
jgi:hypothetical protein